MFPKCPKYHPKFLNVSCSFNKNGSIKNDSNDSVDFGDPLPVLPGAESQSPLTAVAWKLSCAARETHPSRSIAKVCWSTAPVQIEQVKDWKSECIITANFRSRILGVDFDNTIQKVSLILSQLNSFSKVYHRLKLRCCFLFLGLLGCVGLVFLHLHEAFSAAVVEVRFMPHMRPQEAQTPSATLAMCPFIN